MILIANIGNRNFTYRGKSVAEHLKGLNTTFREFTKSLVLGDQENNIELVILDSILREYGNHISKIVLVATNQQRGDNRDQDTHYAAELVKRRINLTPEWKNITIEIEELPISIERTAEVMNWYKRILIKTYGEHSDAEFLICDAGGAPQMKTPLKIMAEFILPADKYAVKYVLQQTGEVVDVEQVEYRKVLTAYQIESLLPTLNYRAASDLWRGITGLPEAKDNLLLMLTFANARSQMLFDDARNAANRAGGRMKDSAVDLRSYAENKVEDMPDIQFDAQHIYRAKEYLALCDYAQQNNNLNGMVLHARQFEEYMLGAVLENYLQINLLSDYNGSKEQLKQYASDNNLKIGKWPITTDSVHARMAIAKTISDTHLKEWLKTFDKVESPLSKGIGALRNSLVHEGKSITEAKLQEFCPELNSTITDWKKLILFYDENPYDTINKEILRLMKG